MQIQACRDPKDDYVLELAVSGQANCVVTGDQDLLVLNPYAGIPILDPSTFMATLQRRAAAIALGAQARRSLSP